MYNLIIHYTTTGMPCSRHACIFVILICIASLRRTLSCRAPRLSLVGQFPDALLFRSLDEVFAEVRMGDTDHEFRPLPGVPAGQVDFALVRYDVMGHGAGRGHDLACTEVRLDIAVQITVLILVGAVHAKEGFAARRLVRALDEVDLSACSGDVSGADAF